MLDNLKLTIAAQSEIELMKKKIGELLSKRGMRVDHPELLQILKKAGAVVDEETRYIRFPLKMQEELLAGMTRKFTLAGINAENDLPVPHPDNLFYSGSVTGSLHITTAEGVDRNIQVDDIPEIFQLVNILENVEYYSIVTYEPVDLPQATTDINSLYYALNNSDKFGWIQPFDGPNIKYLLEMASVVVGGKENLAKRPIISPFTCVTEPFIIKNMDGEAVCRNAEYGIPIFCCSMPTAGANAPITQPGSVLMACAEVLGLILMSQCAKPGIPCIAVPEHLMIDMKSMYTLQSSIELQMGRMLSAQLFSEGYQIPAFSWGAGTDAFVPGAESSADVMLTAATSALSGMTFLQDAGQLECCRRYSPLQLIVDNEILGMMKVMKKGFDITEESLGFDEVMKIDEKLSFISSGHTFAHCREIFRPRVFNYRSRDVWESEGRPDLYDRGRDMYNDFKKNYKPRFLPDDVNNELKSIVAHANKTIGGL